MSGLGKQMCAVAFFRGAWGGIKFSKDILYFVAPLSPSAGQIFDCYAGGGGGMVTTQGTSDSNSPSEPLGVWVKAIKERGTTFHACLYLQRMAILKSKLASLQGLFPSLSLALSWVRSSQTLNPTGWLKGLPSLECNLRIGKVSVNPGHVLAGWGVWWENQV